jgi:hypothetical protein
MLFANDPFAAMLGYPRDVVLMFRFDQIFTTSALNTPALSAKRTRPYTVVKLRHAEGLKGSRHTWADRRC